MKEKQLVLYRNFEQQEIFTHMVTLMEHPGGHDAIWYQVVNELAALADAHGFYGNLWHAYLAYVLATHENAFSTSCEIVGKREGSINRLACHDLSIFKALMDTDLKFFSAYYPKDLVETICSYENDGENSKVFNSRIRDRIMGLAGDLARAGTVPEYMEIVTRFYKECGVGTFGLHKAFRLEETNGETEIVPINNIAHVHFSDLVGYEAQKQKLIENTKAFVEGRKANNCLLFGDSGTGKSSSIKAVLNEYYDQGLRMIEVYKHQFRDLAAVISEIKHRNYKFIIYMDDLSFEDFEIEYKYLKAIIEGGLEKKPENVLIYATSNRRHLIRERFSDKQEAEDDLHKNDTVQEKLSLVARFGVQIYYPAPEKKEFQVIVRELARRYGLKMPEEELLLEANRWELSHGGLSGRTALQFIHYLLGRVAL